jgi:hypothetical protein
MMRTHRPRVEAIAAIALAMYATCARAADPDAAPLFSFSGFGTLAAVHSSERNADYAPNSFKPVGAGFSRSWSAATDSLIAAQVSANPATKLSAVVQIIAEQNYDNTYRPHVEWANIKYQFTPDFSVRAGRTVLPILIATDTRKVGFANPWLRPPGEVYSLIGVTSNDGVDASFRMRAGDASNTLQLTAGASDSKLAQSGGLGSGTAKARKLVLLQDTFEMGFASLHFNYGRARITLAQLDPLFDAFRQFGPEGVAIADKYEVQDDFVTLIGVGAAWNPGRWFATGEWVQARSRSILGTKSAWYVSGGYRFGPVTPYATYAQARAGSLHDPGLDVATLPPFLAGPASAVNGALNFILASRVVQSTVSVGARWDFHRNTAFKVQYDHARVDAGSFGLVNNIQPEYRPGGRFDVFSVALDFVF